MQSMIDAEILIFLEQIAAGPSLSAAARRMGVTRSALSHRLNSIEARMGVTLFHRSTRRLDLSEVGRALLGHAERIASEVAEANATLTQTLGEVSGRLRMTAPVAFGHVWLTPRLNAFLTDFPGVELELVLFNRRVDMVEERFDLAIRVGTSLPPELVSRRLASFEWRFCASPGYLARRGVPERAEDLLSHRCLAFASPGAAPDRLSLREAAEQRAVTVRPCLQTNDLEYLMQATLAGQGISLLPDYAIGADLTAGRLILVLEQCQPVTRLGNQAYALFPRHRVVPRRLRELVDYLASSSWDAPGRARSDPVGHAAEGLRDRHIGRAHRKQS